MAKVDVDEGRRLDGFLGSGMLRRPEKRTIQSFEDHGRKSR